MEKIPASKVPCEDYELGSEKEPSYSPLRRFKKLKCLCGSTTFEALYTRDFETSVRCTECKRFYVIHEG